jgi:fatty acid desaturase
MTTATRPVPNDYATARRRIAAAIGTAALARLHRQNPVLDWLVVVLLPAAFAGLALVLAARPLGPGWLACFVLQGVVIQTMAYAVHDLFVHRRVGGRRLGYLISVAFHLPIFYRRTWYALYHVDHHTYMGTRWDTEAYKQDLDTRWKRLACLTAPGLILALGRKLKPVDAFAPEIRQGPLVTPTDPALVRRLRAEGLAVRLLVLALVPLAVWWWQLVVLGLVLPFAVVIPLLSLVRIVLEHAETTPGNVYHCATYYRTGPITRPLYFWDAGDCHVVHHIFPAIPFYRMGEALRLIRPILTAEGARERHSLLELLHGFLVRVEPHRAVWSR